MEQLRLVKSPAEIALIRRAAHYADRGVAELFVHSYYGATVAEGFARISQVTQAIIRETPSWDALATRVLMASFPAPLSAMPHAVPSPGDRLLAGPHVTLVLTRVNGYAAESERTYFTAPPTRQERQLFALMAQARRIGLGLWPAPRSTRRSTPSSPTKASAARRSACTAAATAPAWGTMKAPGWPRARTTCWPPAWSSPWSRASTCKAWAANAIPTPC
nr:MULTISPECIES: hypothetical protein [Pseudomonas]